MTGSMMCPEAANQRDWPNPESSIGAMDGQELSATAASHRHDRHAEQKQATELTAEKRMSLRSP